MKTLSLLTLLLVGLCSTAIAADSDLEKSLTSKYKDQVLILRHPIDSNSQRYNSGGELLSGGKEGPWTVNAAIEINEIHVTQDKLIIDGKRRVYGFDSRQNRLLPVKVKERDKPRVTLEISLDSPLVSVEQVETVLHRIFANNAGELTESVPVYWRSFLAKQYGVPNPDASQTVAQDSGGSNSAARDELNVVKLDPKTIKPPRPVSTPDPSYSEVAKHLQFKGTMVLTGIIDATGKVRQVRIVRPVGFGLDEKGIEAVHSWKFKPATHDGKPVAVEMGLEISFNLY